MGNSNQGFSNSPPDSSPEDEFLQDFIQETQEHLESVERYVLELESHPRDTELIHSLFRCFHTVKGLAGFVGQDIIQSIAHKTETLLDFCRKGKHAVQKMTIDLILQSADLIKNICRNISLTSQEEFMATVEKHLMVLYVLLYEDNESKEPATVHPVEKFVVEENPVFNEPVKENVRISETKQPPEIQKTVERQPIIHKTDEQPPIIENAAQQPSIIESASENHLVVEKPIAQQTFPLETFPQESPVILECDNPETVEAEDPFWGTPACPPGAEDKPDEIEHVTEAPAEEPQIAPELPRTQSIPQVPVEKSAADAVVEQKRTILSSHSIDQILNQLGEVTLLFSYLEQELETRTEENTKLRSQIARISRILQNVQNIAISLGLVPFSDCYRELMKSLSSEDTTTWLKITFTESPIKLDTSFSEFFAKQLSLWIRSKIMLHLRSTSAHFSHPALELSLNSVEKEGQAFLKVCCKYAGILEKQSLSSLLEIDFLSEVFRDSGYVVRVKEVEATVLEFWVKIPSHSVLMNGTIVELEGYTFMIPTNNVKSIVKPSEEQWIAVKGRRKMVNVRNQLIPLIPIDEVFKFDSQGLFQKDMLVIVLEYEGEFKALPVHKIIGRRDVILKTLGKEFEHLAFLSGGAILENGKISLIINVENLFQIGKGSDR